MLRSALSPKRLGPGVVAGASDNDPTTVGTLTSVGASTGYSLAWVTVVLLPMLAVVQTIAAQVGVVTGRRLSVLAAERYGASRSRLLMLSIVAVNVLTIAADLQAGAAACGLLTGLGYQWFVPPLAVGLLALVTPPSTAGLHRFLKGVMLIFFAYGVSAIVAHPDWSAVAHGTFVPSLHGGQAVQGALAMLGTTLTAYVFLWETTEHAERRPRVPLRLASREAVAGIAFAVFVFWSTLVASGATLARAHVDPQSAQQAAAALVPVAGRAASDVFAIGLLGSALLALPVLLATTAHVVCDHRRHAAGAGARGEGRRFAAVVVASLACGCAVALVGVPLVGILVAASVAGGLATPLALGFLMRVAGDSTVMRGRPVSRRLLAGGWTVTVVIGVLGLAYLVTEL